MLIAFVLVDRDRYVAEEKGLIDLRRARQARAALGIDGSVASSSNL
jgi:hypothetical protein